MHEPIFHFYLANNFRRTDTLIKLNAITFLEDDILRSFRVFYGPPCAIVVLM